MAFTFHSALLTFLVVISTSGVIGNIIVSLIYAFRLEKSKKRERYFLLVLAIVDFFGCTFQGLHQILRLIKYRIPGQLFCSFLMFFVFFAVGASAMILLFIAIHRYRKICRPFGRQLNHIHWRRICLAITLLVSFVYSLPIGIMEYSNSVFHLPNKSTGVVTLYLCGFVDNASVFDLAWHGLGLILIVLLSLITVGLYFPVIYRTRKMFRKFKTICDENEILSDRHTEKCKVIDRNGAPIDDSKIKTALRILNKMCFVMALVNSVSYVPYCTIVALLIMNVNFIRTVTGYRIIQFFLCIPLLQHAVNPFINIAFDLELRRQISKMYRSFLYRDHDTSN